MNLNFFFVWILSTVGGIYSKATNNMSPRIFNGEGARIEEFPHTAILHYRCRQLCTGAIVSRDIILTAGHCLTDVTNMDYLVITVGTTDCHRLINKQFVKEYIIHEDYDDVSDKTWNDIAVIRLKKPLGFDTRLIQPINLAKAGFEIPLGKTVGIAACGYLDNRNNNVTFATRLMKANVVAANCLKGAPDKNTICLNVTGVSICPGDSGAAFVIDGRLVGIDSRGGDVCGYDDDLELATKISLYTKWIQDTIDKMKGTPATISDY